MKENCQSFLRDWPTAACTCVKTLKTSLGELHKCRLCTTARFQRFTPWAVIAYTNACVNDECLQRGPRRPRRCPRRGNAEDKQFHIPKLSLSCIFIELHLCLKSLKTYLTMLNIFDLLLSLMQTDNYVYFLLPIDTSCFFFNLFILFFFYERSRQYQSSVCSYKDTLQLLSGKQFVIVIFIFAFRSTLKLLARQTGKIEH